ncbi:MAG: MBL fold metallo-hydrolase [archaeon]
MSAKILGVIKMSLESKIWGTRGSMAQPHRDYMEYGGNTSSVTVRTSENSLLFLDAGTGIQYAAKEELKTLAEKVYLCLSHTHADHVMGLGMSALPWVTFRPEYKNKQAQLIGPEGVVHGLQRFYDGELNKNQYTKCMANENWPVAATDNPDVKPNMPGITLGYVGKPLEPLENEVCTIDEKTSMKVMRGSHPVSGESLLYRIENGGKSLVYAVDNEFDFLNGGVPNKDAEAFEEKYVRFVKGADVLIADAQYTKDEYIGKKPSNVQGFGHAYIEQVIDLAAKAGVKKVMPFHHHTAHNDAMMREIEQSAKAYAKEKGYNLEVEFAKEGMVINL